jgi:hypothetical protein
MPSVGSPRHERLARLLLGSCSVLACALVFLSAYVLRTRAHTQRLQMELAQRLEVQRRTMEQLPSDQCLFPHFKNSIGYVFNPFMNQCTLWGRKERPYAVSPLGLRGPNSAEAIPGHRRIVLLGDSWFFGWRLADEDRLDVHLRAVIGDPRVEVITAAVPGWNVISEAAFLESHVRHLDPDVVLWETCPNDTWDVGDVIPPGQLTYVMSPQNPDAEANGFTEISLVMPGLPAVLARYTRNLRRMQELQARFGVPVLAAPVDIPPALWALASEKSGVSLPAQFIPPAVQADPRSRISDHDSHPTPWMNRRLAVGYASRLVELGHLSPLSLDAEDQKVAEAFRQANRAAAAGSAGVDAYLRAQAEALPERYAGDADLARVAAGLLGGSAFMGRRGLLHLRVPDGASAIVLEVEAEPYAARFARELEIRVRNYEGRAATARRAFDGAGQRVTVEAELPRPPGRYPAWELEWSFNYDDCGFPTQCRAARLVRAASR